MAKLLDSIGPSVPDEFAIAVSLGKVPGWRSFRKFGHNPDVDTGTEDVWSAGGVKVWPTSAAIAVTSSSSAEDDPDEATPPGTGAWTVTIEGLDSSFLEVSETITMNGTTPVNTTQTFIRINRAYVVTAGSTKSNVGNITITVGGNTQAYIAAGLGQTLQAIYTVPADQYLVVTLYTLVCGELPTAADYMDFQGQIRLNGGETDEAWRVISNIFLPTGSYQNTTSATLLPPKTDVRMQVVSSSNNNAVTGIFGGYLVKAGYVNTL